MNFVLFGFLIGLRLGRGLVWSWDAARDLHGTTAAKLTPAGTTRGWVNSGYKSWLSRLATELRRGREVDVAEAKKLGFYPLQVTEVALLQRATVTQARDAAERRRRRDAEIKSAAAAVQMSL